MGEETKILFFFWGLVLFVKCFDLGDQSISFRGRKLLNDIFIIGSIDIYMGLLLWPLSLERGH